jgi:hypothetical protein
MSLDCRLKLKAEEALATASTDSFVLPAKPDMSKLLTDALSSQ